MSTVLILVFIFNLSNAVIRHSSIMIQAIRYNKESKFEALKPLFQG